MWSPHKLWTGQLNCVANVYCFSNPNSYCKPLFERHYKGRIENLYLSAVTVRKPLFERHYKEGLKNRTPPFAWTPLVKPSQRRCWKWQGRLHRDVSFDFPHWIFDYLSIAWVTVSGVGRNLQWGVETLSRILTSMLSLMMRLRKAIHTFVSEERKTYYNYSICRLYHQNPSVTIGLASIRGPAILRAGDTSFMMGSIHGGSRSHWYVQWRTQDLVKGGYAPSRQQTCAVFT